jgi:hypothetical protein
MPALGASQIVRGAFTPQSAAGGIGPCLSTGEPRVPAATNVPFPRCPALPRSIPAPPRAAAFQNQGRLRPNPPQAA